MRQPLEMPKLAEIVLIPLVVILLCTGCTSTPNPQQGNSVNLEFPYRASSERKTQILNAIPNIRAGMAISEAKEFAGAPDAVLPLYEPKIKNPNQIGRTHWYYIKIDDPNKKTDASLMRISTDMNGMVSKLDHWGVETSTDAAR